jgi:hypothetical protein
MIVINNGVAVDGCIDVSSIFSRIIVVDKNVLGVDGSKSQRCRRNPLHPQTPAQAVFTPELIVDDCYPSRDVLTSVDAVTSIDYAVSPMTVILILLATSLHPFQDCMD